MAMETLTEDEKKVLDFEETLRVEYLTNPPRRFSQRKSKNTRIYDAGWKPNNYYLVLSQAMNKPAVVTEYPEIYRAYHDRVNQRESERHGQRRQAS